jgi:hypothetical protein
MSKLKENQFYCVSCRTKRTCKADDMGVKVYRNRSMYDRKVPVLKCECPKCGTPLTKFIKHDSQTRLTEKYGKW